jgi:hypothetical protein
MMRLIDRIEERLAARSGLETNRAYVGMSRAGDCPLAIYRDVRNGIRPTAQKHLAAWLGYRLEEAMLTTLCELVQPGRNFDLLGGMLQGHTDGEIFGKLFEIKTYSSDAVRECVERREPTPRHYAQAQEYMLHGGYQQALILYIPRDVGHLDLLHVDFQPYEAEAFDQKLRHVVECLQQQTPPQCLCGKCARRAA